jgi:H+/Cl- antiporter ClcA
MEDGMDDFVNNPWAISIFSGIISTFVGGLLLAVVKGAQPRSHSVCLELLFQDLARLLLYGICMVAITGVLIFTYNQITSSGGGLFPLSAEFTGLLFILGWLFTAVYFFGVIFFGWKTPS